MHFLCLPILPIKYFLDARQYFADTDIINTGKKQFILPKKGFSLFEIHKLTRFMTIKQIAYLITPHPCRGVSLKTEQNKKDDHRPI